MRIKVERRWPKDKYIIGRLYIDGEFICNTLEPPWKDNARYTAIPKGIYEVIMNYSPKFKRVLPLVHFAGGEHEGGYGAELHEVRGEDLQDDLRCPWAS